MRKGFLYAVVLVLFHFCGNAQSKIFKEVGEGISTKVVTIRQDDALVGYLAFTELEKASEDSINYRVTIMDENLNDISVVNFRDENLMLYEVSVEKDILCLAYRRDNMNGKAYRKASNWDKRDAVYKASIFLQFLGLDGKILNKVTVPAIGKVVEKIQFTNIPQYGFACFYGDSEGNYLLACKADGETYWRKPITRGSQSYSLLTSKQGVYLLIRKKVRTMDEGGFVMLNYGVMDGKEYSEFVFKDKSGNALKVFSFGTDPITGTPYVSGNIIDEKRGDYHGYASELPKGPYMGVFTFNFGVHPQDEVKRVYTYWNEGSQSFMNEKGYFKEQQAYVVLNHAFKDYEGNTFFVGPSVYEEGYTKVGDPFVIKQSSEGGLTFDNSIPTEPSKKKGASMGYIAAINNKFFYSIGNPVTKVTYLIVDDLKDISIYSVNDRRVTRKIPRKEGDISTYVFPAKEGHIMVSEHNKKEKYTRVSIEAL